MLGFSLEIPLKTLKNNKQIKIKSIKIQGIYYKTFKHSKKKLDISSNDVTHQITQKISITIKTVKK